MGGVSPPLRKGRMGGVSPPLRKGRRGGVLEAKSRVTSMRPRVEAEVSAKDY
ncbi:MAG: hypothetical protein HXY47_06425 [Nitrospirae bacterium]|nr:hypothetical protein [Nitrospirota bacterium]